MDAPGSTPQPFPILVARQPSWAAVRRRLRAGLLVNLGLSAASLILCAGALELAARLAQRGSPERVAALGMEPHPLWGWRHRPGAAGSYGSVPIHINSRGLRDVEHETAAPSGVRRVLVLGDSFAEGSSVPLEDAVPRALERRLRVQGCAVEVVGAGTTGYSTDQEYLFYRDEGAAYGASTVVLFFYYNDILANAGAAGPGGISKPLFTFMGGTPRVKNYPLPLRRPEAPPARWHGSAALTFARERLRGGAPRAYDALARLGLWPRLRREELPLEMCVYERTPPAAVVQAWLQTEHLLGLIQSEAGRRGARLFVAYVPSKMEVSATTWELTRGRYLLDEAALDRGRVASLLRVTGRRLGIPVLDLTDALRAVQPASGPGPYFERGGHWNALGHDVVARAVAAALTNAGPSSCGPAAH